MARMKDLYIDLVNAGAIEPEGLTQFVDPATCPHPPTRQFAWHAHDDTLCVACCDCGKVLQGEAMILSPVVGDKIKSEWPDA